jgi:hypothetical protein
MRLGGFHEADSPGHPFAAARWPSHGCWEHVAATVLAWPDLVVSRLLEVRSVITSNLGEPRAIVVDDVCIGVDTHQCQSGYCYCGSSATPFVALYCHM